MKNFTEAKELAEISACENCRNGMEPIFKDGKWCHEPPGVQGKLEEQKVFSESPAQGYAASLSIKRSKSGKDE